MASAHLFHSAEVGSNPGGDRDPPNIPKPPLCLLVVFSIGRAYLKVHGGPAPPVRSVLAGRHEPWRRRCRQRSIPEVHGCFVPGSVGSMPAAKRVDDGAGGRLLSALFWHIVVAL